MAATTERTDVHRPAALVPEDYGLLGVFDHHEEDGNHYQYMELVQGMVAKGHRFAEASPNGGGSGTCGHCGHPGLRYSALMLHEPSGELLNVGEQCLDNRFSETTARFHRLRREAKLNRERRNLRAAFDQALADDPELATAYAEGDGHYIVDDIRSKHRRYGSISDKQRALVIKVAGEEAERERLEAERQAKREAALASGFEAPTGRQEVTGRVVGTRVSEGMYGTSYRITVLVEAEQEWRVNLTCPSKLTDLLNDEQVEASGDHWVNTRLSDLRGRTVTVTATLEEPDEGDPLFRFGKRPTKPVLHPQQEA